MAIPLALIGMGLSAIGSGINAYQNSKANELAENNYNTTRERLLSDMYANPLDSVANKALLSQMDRRLNKREEAVANQAAASGATFENVLAAKQASNEAMADVVSGIMQGETARQDSFRQQLLDLESKRTEQQMAAKQASGQNWSNLFGNVAGGLTSLGGTMLENGLSFKDLFKA